MRPITANDLMNPNVLAIRDTASMKELAAFLVDNEITGAPVEDRAGKLVGVASAVDVVRLQAKGEDGDKLKVKDLMTRSVYTVSEDATVSEVASTMIDHHLHRLLVTRDGQPVGIISTSDLLGLLVDEDED